MASDLTAQRTQRPDSNRKVEYTLSPSYYKHQAYEDKLAILVCKIRIWEAKGHDWFNIPSDCTVIRECESVEITDSAKDLINKAVVRFPRGTVISLSRKKDQEVQTGDKSDSTESTKSLESASNNGEVITTGSSTFKENGISTTSVAINYDDKGLVDFNRTSTEPSLLSPNDVAIGNRIEIRLGYAYSDTEFKKMNVVDSIENLDVVFTGFITAISVDTPLELECTNMAHVLACVSTPNIPDNTTLTVKDFLDDDGKYHLLKDTGIPLAPKSKGSNILIQGSTITDNLTVADVLDAWAKSGIACIMELKNDGSAQLKVGKNYNTDKGGSELPNNDPKYITYNEGINTVKLIQFDWDVAQDKLTLKQNDKKYLAVEAHGKYTDIEGGKKVIKLFKLTIRKNPDTDDDEWISEDGEKFQVVNHFDLTKTKNTKTRGGSTNCKRVKGRLLDRVNLDKYNVVTYFSTTKNVTKDQLVEEAIQYWNRYTPNGISGSIVIFGDLIVRPTEIIGLIDMRQPHKNGYYYVESVNTTFGMDGYRRELKLPYKVASIKEVKII